MRNELKKCTRLLVAGFLPRARLFVPVPSLTDNFRDDHTRHHDLDKVLVYFSPAIGNGAVDENELVAKQSLQGQKHKCHDEIGQGGNARIYEEHHEKENLTQEGTEAGGNREQTKQTKGGTKV